MVEPRGYDVVPVNVPGCLHLKTGCTALDDQTVLINEAWVDAGPFEGFRRLQVPAGEPFGANILRLGETILMHAGFTETRALVEQAGFSVRAVDIGEFLKAEAGLTCMSLVFDA